MNLYQGLGQSPMNYIDPFGNKKFNLFFNYDRNWIIDSNNYQVRIGKYLTGTKLLDPKTIRAIPLAFPDWKGLQEIATIYNHELCIHKEDDYTLSSQTPKESYIKDLENSLAQKDTSTFIIGHSDLYSGFRGSEFGLITGPFESNNDYIGAFGCHTDLFACDVFNADQKQGLLFSVSNQKGTDIYNIEWVAYNIMLSLMVKYDDSNEAQNRGKAGLRQLSSEIRRIMTENGLDASQIKLEKNDYLYVNPIPRKHGD